MGGIPRSAVGSRVNKALFLDISLIINKGLNSGLQQATGSSDPPHAAHQEPLGRQACSSPDTDLPCLPGLRGPLIRARDSKQMAHASCLGWTSDCLGNPAGPCPLWVRLSLLHQLCLGLRTRLSKTLPLPEPRPQLTLGEHGPRKKQTFTGLGHHDFRVVCYKMTRLPCLSVGVGGKTKMALVLDAKVRRH